MESHLFYLSPEEKALLQYRYIKKGGWVFLEFKMNMSRSTLTRIDAHLIDKLRDAEQK